MNADDLKKRTKQFALRILKLVAALPNTVGGRAIGGQLVLSGTSVGSNYRAACRGRSRAEFVAKLGVVEEEADESAFWMEMIIEADNGRRQTMFGEVLWDGPKGDGSIVAGGRFLDADPVERD